MNTEFIQVAGTWRTFDDLGKSVQQSKITGHTRKQNSKGTDNRNRAQKTCHHRIIKNILF